MKTKILLFAIVMMSLGACTQKMCPTYAKDDVKQEVKADERV